MTFNKEFSKWKKDHNAHGSMAFTRFVIFKFAEGLSEATKNKYTLKGGNLLWLYIRTPRPTIDLDLTFEELLETKEFLDDISKIQVAHIKFSVASCVEKIKKDSKGLSITIYYKIEGGSSNTFPIDIVLGVPAETRELLVLKKYLKVATEENILIDKISTCQSFRGGNTRMKDYDDLFRTIIDPTLKIKPKALVLLSQKRGVELIIDKKWINDAIEESWSNHLSQKAYVKQSGDLPRNIEEVFDIINDFLNNVKNIAKNK